MDLCWKKLPNELFCIIANYLNPAIRRDLGFKPRKIINLPFINFPKKSYATWFFKDSQKLIEISFDDRRLFTMSVILGINCFNKIADDHYEFSYSDNVPSKFQKINELYVYTILKTADLKERSIYYEHYDNVMYNRYNAKLI
jgi:hypothetical protein